MLTCVKLIDRSVEHRVKPKRTLVADDINRLLSKGFFQMDAYNKYWIRCPLLDKTASGAKGDTFIFSFQIDLRGSDICMFRNEYGEDNISDSFLTAVCEFVAKELDKNKPTEINVGVYIIADTVEQQMFQDVTFSGLLVAGKVIV